jgi:hypothetical protein
VQDLEHRLAAWVDDAIISPHQAERIAAFERERGHATRDPGAPAQPRRSAVAEAIGYLGALLALSAVGLIVGDLWPSFTVTGQLTLVGLLTVVAAGAGQAVHGQPTAAMARLSGVLWAAAAVGAAWFAGIVAAEVADAGSAVTTIAVGLAGASVAVPSLLRRPALPLQLVALAALSTVAVGALGLGVLRPDVFFHGLLVAAVGGAWLLLGRGGWIHQRSHAEVLGGLVALGGLQVASFGDPRELALGSGLLVAAGAVALAVRQEAQHLLIVGALGGFVLLPQLVVALFGDAIGAPATLLVVGLVLVLLAVGLGRVRDEVRPGSRDGPGPGGRR